MTTDTANKHFWEKVAVLYAPFTTDYRNQYKELCRMFSKYLQKDMDVLELACGSGQFTLPLSDMVRSWEASDFSPRMVEQAKKRCGSAKVHFCVQDATNLTYNPERFDAVFIANALHIMPDPAAALAEIHRVLKPEGLLLAPTFVYENKLPKLKIWLMERIGFRTFHKWNCTEYAAYVQERGFTILEHSLIKGNVLGECALAGKKTGQA